MIDAAELNADVAIETLNRIHLQVAAALRDDHQPMVMVMTKDLACLLVMASLWAEQSSP